MSRWGSHWAPARTPGARSSHPSLTGLVYNCTWLPAPSAPPREEEEVSCRQRALHRGSTLHANLMQAGVSMPHGELFFPSQNPQRQPRQPLRIWKEANTISAALMSSRKEKRTTFQATMPSGSRQVLQVRRSYR